MALVRWEPQNLGNLRSEIDRLFDRFWRRHGDAEDISTWHPTVDMTESDDAYVITADLPGMSREDITVQIANNTLMLSGTRQSEHKDETSHQIERVYGSFHRSLILPSGVKEDEMAAKYDNGVLTITLQKAEEAKPKLIEVA